MHRDLKLENNLFVGIDKDTVLKATDIGLSIYYKPAYFILETADRLGLLLEIVQTMANININVESAEIETEGLVAKDKFHVSYRGAALNSSLSQEHRHLLIRVRCDSPDFPP